MITFFLTWFPSYLVGERGFNLLKLGVFGMIPPLAAILGSWAGGLIGDYLSVGPGLVAEQGPQDVSGRRHDGLRGDRAGRHRPGGLAGARADVDFVCGGAFTIVSIWCLPADVVDSSTVAILGSTQNFFSNLGSALSPIIIGALYGATGSFEVPLLLTAAIIVAGALCFGLLIKKVEPIRRPELETTTT